MVIQDVQIEALKKHSEEVKPISNSLSLKCSRQLVQGIEWVMRININVSSQAGPSLSCTPVWKTTYYALSLDTMLCLAQVKAIHSSTPEISTPPVSTSWIVWSEVIKWMLLQIGHGSLGGRTETVGRHAQTHTSDGELAKGCKVWKCTPHIDKYMYYPRTVPFKCLFQMWRLSIFPNSSQADSPWELTSLRLALWWILE